MGWWNQGVDGSSLHVESTGLVWGDRPADEVYRLLFGSGKKAHKRAERLGRQSKRAAKTIRAQFNEAFERDPTKQEMVAGIMFEFGRLRSIIATLPDGPAPAPTQTAPGMLNVGPMSDVEWGALADFVALDEQADDV